MTEGDIGGVLRQTMLVTLKLGGPLLAAMLVIGLLVSIVQSATQISEPTLVFAPKLLAVFAVLMLLGSVMLATLTDFTTLLFDRLVAIGGA